MGGKQPFAWEICLENSNVNFKNPTLCRDHFSAMVMTIFFEVHYYFSWPYTTFF